MVLIASRGMLTVRIVLESMCADKMKAAKQVLVQQDPDSRRLTAMYESQLHKISLFHRLESEMEEKQVVPQHIIHTSSRM